MKTRGAQAAIAHQKRGGLERQKVAKLIAADVETSVAIRFSRNTQAVGKPQVALRLAQQQQRDVGGLLAAGKMDCEFLARDG